MWVAGARGIKVQNAEGKLELREPGQPVPEAFEYKKIRMLVSRKRLAWQDEDGKIHPKQQRASHGRSVSRQVVALAAESGAVSHMLPVEEQPKAVIIKEKPVVKKKATKKAKIKHKTAAKRKAATAKKREL